MAPLGRATKRFRIPVAVSPNPRTGSGDRPPGDSSRHSRRHSRAVLGPAVVVDLARVRASEDLEEIRVRVAALPRLAGEPRVSLAFVIRVAVLLGLDERVRVDEISRALDSTPREVTAARGLLRRAIG